MTTISNYIQAMLNNPKCPQGKRFMLFIQFCIILSLIAFTVETLPDNAPWAIELLDIIEKLTVGIFTIEYLLRLASSKKRAKFVFSGWGLIDLLAILPFYLYLLTGMDSRFLKAIRLLRVLRIFKLLKFGNSIAQFKRAFEIAKDDLIVFGTLAVILIYISGVGVYFCEHEAQPIDFASIFDGIWWAVITLTTVGYGDIYPVTTAGKMFTFVLLIIGLAIISIPTGLITSALTKAREEAK